MITREQMRMARAALRWTVDELAERATVGRNTVWRFEAGKDANPATLAAIERALAAAGIQFVDGPDGIGVLLRRSAPAGADDHHATERGSHA